MTTMTRIDPLREMDRFFSDMLRGPSTSTMPMDLYRTGDTFIAEIDLPGVDPASLEIGVEDRTLTVRAERRSSAPEDGQWLTAERPTGTFTRQLTLGYGVASDRIEADYTDGVLRLTIPLADEAKPRRITIARGTAGGDKADGPAEVEA